MTDRPDNLWAPEITMPRAPVPERTRLHDELVARAVTWLRSSQNCKVVFAEISVQACSTIPDAIGWKKNGRSILVECKTSRSDFAADAFKVSHRKPECAIGDLRWYMVPKDLVRPEEVAAPWGLIDVSAGGRLRILKPAIPTPPRTHKEEITYLVAAVQRHELGILWEVERARFQSYKASRKRR